jgi:thiol-disulfide isomerase/thioredoxin|tara:strand:+ start:136 stop:546 length:411 start_codon:yes stop_codon:yes gene_type:complete
MKYLILILMPLLSIAQSEVPDEYWLDDNKFEEIISDNSAFGDDNQETIVVEFWAKFNEANCFAEWNQLQNAKYYRVDIAKAANAKKKYKVRMAPTIIIFKGGIKEVVWKAGLDLVLPTDLDEIQESINEINNANKF